MKKILLTGATGFIGSHLLEELLIQGYEVVVLKRSTSLLWRIDEMLSKLSTFDSDINSIETLFEDNVFDAIIHLATKYVKHDDGVGIAEMYNANVILPAQLLELAYRNNVKCFINTGTFFEYDCQSLPISESAPIKPFNLYAKTKIAFENVVKSYDKEMDIITFRLFSPYGEKDNEKLIPMIVKKALKNEEIVLSDGMQKLDFVYVNDIVSAYSKMLFSTLDKTDHGSYEVYNLGSGVPVSVREVVSVIEQKLNKRLNLVWGEPSLIDIPVAYADINKLCGKISWYPKYNIHDGISNTIKYYQNLSK